MGAKTALLVYAEQHPADLLRQAPELDRDAASALVAALLRSLSLAPPAKES